MVRLLPFVCLLLATMTPLASADLPPVTPPTEPPPEPDMQGVTIDAEQAAHDELVRQVQLRANVGVNNGAIPGVAGQKEAVDIDVLMKSVADPNLPMSDDLNRQFQDVNDFARLTIEQKKEVVPELLALLGNATPLAVDRMGRPARRSPLQVRHRVNMALSNIARVYFGQFPVVSPSATQTPEQEAASREASAALAKSWQDWWEDASDADDEQWAEVSSAARRPLIESDDRTISMRNTVMAVQHRDTSIMPVLVKHLKAASLDDKAFMNQVINSYGQLCTDERATAEDQMVIIDFMRNNNTPDVCRQTSWIRQCASYARRFTGLSIPYLESIEVEVDDNGVKRTQQVQMLKPEALKQWDDIVRQKLDKERAVPNPDSGVDNPVGPDADAPQENEDAAP